MTAWGRYRPRLSLCTDLKTKLATVEVRNKSGSSLQKQIRLITQLPHSWKIWKINPQTIAFQSFTCVAHWDRKKNLGEDNMGLSPFYTGYFILRCTAWYLAAKQARLGRCVVLLSFYKTKSPVHNRIYALWATCCNFIMQFFAFKNKGDMSGLEIVDPEQRKEGHLSKAPMACGPSTKM